jgi:hypothetical protein
MKKLVFIPILVFLFSCAPDFDFDTVGSMSSSGGYGSSTPLPGTPATFTIVHNDTTFEIAGDAYSVGWGFYDGPGSAMHRKESYYYPDPVEYYYTLDCIGTYASRMQISFDFYTNSLGKPIQAFATEMYYAHNVTFLHGKEQYQAYHYSDAAINQQLYAVIQITKISEGRIDGTFTGKFYQTNPGAEKFVTISGKFKNVYVHDELW